MRCATPGPAAIDVHCVVHAPDARITVTDDGRGLQRPREDSHGLEIMRERAALISASLSISPGPHGGTRVEVRTPVLDESSLGQRRPRWDDERMSDEPTRVLLVDDHELIRSGLAGVFELEDDMTIVGTAGTVGEALAAYDELSPDVVVSDLQLQDGTGLDIIRAIRRRQQHDRAGRAHHARRRRPDLRRHGGRRVRLRRQGRAVHRGRARGPARRRGAPLLRLQPARPAR